jgi:hypothetical protein
MSSKGRKERSYRGELCGSGHAAPRRLLPPAPGVRRQFASQRGRERRIDRFLSLVVPATSRPSGFGITKTLAPHDHDQCFQEFGGTSYFPERAGGSLWPQ